MIQDWFKDALKYYGHVRLDHFACLRGSYMLGAKATLRRLELREDMRDVIRFQGSSDTVERIKTVKALIEESEMPFQSRWTSFRADDEIIFAFKNEADAVRFRLLWPEDEAE